MDSLFEDSQTSVNYADDGELLKYGLQESWVGGIRLAVLINFAL